MAYDPLTNQSVLFGGYANSAYGPIALGDTWTWNGTTWTHQSPVHVPPARSFTQMAFDQQTGQLLMFGGVSPAIAADLADTWTWTGSDWHQLDPAVSPSARDSAAVAYDPTTDQVVMFGGRDGGQTLGDTWTWNGTTWTQQHPATIPPAQQAASMAFDPAIGELVMLTAAGEGANATWAWNGSDWSQLSLPTLPPARSSTAMALDPAAGQVIVTGGDSDIGILLDDTWSLAGGWTQLAPSTPAPTQFDAAITTDPGSGHLVLFGGNEHFGPMSNQTWIWGPLTVTARALPVGVTGQTYSQALQATGEKGAVSWRISAGALPAGLSLSPRGLIAGSPSKPGVFAFTVTITDSSTPAQSTSRPFTLTINQGPIPGVYVANDGDSVINAFALGATGNTAPVATIAGPATTLAAPTGLALDQTGRLYVANSQADAIDVFGPGASGNVAPIRVLSGSQTNLTDPYGVALDAQGDLYVADEPADTITVYPPGAGGDQAPIRTITGSATGLGAPEAVTVDSAGDLWVANTQANTLTEYSPTANGDASPIATIAGDATNLDGPDGVTQDSTGRLIVADSFGPSLDTFTTPVSTSDTPPAVSLAGPATQLSFPVGVDVDAAGREYVGNQFGALTVYGPAASGNSSPIATIDGPATGLSSPGAVAVLPPLHVTTVRLRRGVVGRRYRFQLHALLGRSPLRWRLRGHLPRGLRLTRGGAIIGIPRRTGSRGLTVEVTDATRPAMRARRRLRLTITRR
jgi:hypothetical protein